MGLIYSALVNSFLTVIPSLLVLEFMLKGSKKV